MVSNNRKIEKIFITLFLVLVIVILSIGNYNRWWNIHFLVGPLYFHHWIGIVGATYIALATPIYSLMKHRFSSKVRVLLDFHIFGNLIAFLLVSIHFTQQMGRPPEFAPILGTGLTLYIILSIMVLTGLLQRLGVISKFLRGWRFIHIGLSLSFYIVIIIHVLRTLGVI
jgi:hypothetical protein